MQDIDSMTNQELFESVKEDVIECIREDGLEGVVEMSDEEIWDITGSIFDLSYDLE